MVGKISHLMVHDTYKTIIKLVKSKKLKEPFYPADIVKAARAKNIETLRKFPAMHRKGNPHGASELFTQLKDGKYKLIKPFKYDLK
jgi:hypothetical protein